MQIEKNMSEIVELVFKTSDSIKKNRKIEVSRQCKKTVLH